MTKVNLICLLLLFSFVLYNSAKAQRINIQSLTGETVNSIPTAVPFLLIAPDSRAGAMGDVGAASAPDANSIHWNASKLVFIDKNAGLSMSYTPWLRALVPDINLAYLSGYKHLDKTQVVAASFRYFSLGNFHVLGLPTRAFIPREFAVDVAYSKKISGKISGGMALRYIHSDLTNGILINGVPSHAGVSVATDISVYYQNETELNEKKAVLALGLNISNIGSKISYTKTESNFIPTNLRLGGSLKLDLNQENSISIIAEANKLLVPTPPVYLRDSNGRFVLVNGQKQIAYGRSSDISAAKGMFNSFSDASGGFKEEMNEINYSLGLEYWYKIIVFRTGCFYEHYTKGNRNYLTLGSGVKYKFFGFDFAYLFPITSQNSPLQNTLRFSLLLNF